MLWLYKNVSSWMQQNKHSEAVVLRYSECPNDDIVRDTATVLNAASLIYARRTHNSTKQDHYTVPVEDFRI